MNSIRVFSLCVLLIAVQLVTADEYQNCGEKCDDCQYGFTKSKQSGFNVCYKPPGHKCDSVDVEEGLCALGTACKLDRCRGCGIDQQLSYRCYGKYGTWD